MELIGRSIRAYVANRTDVDAASDMLVGSLFAGIAFSWARLGNVHAMSHPVSAYFDVPHGVANAILLPTILDYNKLADKGKYKKIYEYVSETHRSDESFTPDMLVDAIRALNNSLSIPANLTEVGVTEDKINVMADDAMKSGNIMVNPRRSTKKDIVALTKSKCNIINLVLHGKRIVACRQPFSIEDIICKTTLRDNDLHGKIYYSESYAMYGI